MHGHRMGSAVVQNRGGKKGKREKSEAVRRKGNVPSLVPRFHPWRSEAIASIDEGYKTLISKIIRSLALATEQQSVHLHLTVITLGFATAHKLYPLDM